MKSKYWILVGIYLTVVILNMLNVDYDDLSWDSNRFQFLQIGLWSIAAVVTILSKKGKE